MEYGKLKIKDTYGISFLEFINLPRFKINILIETGILLQEENKKIIDSVLNGVVNGK
jgi:hypothetical protein